MSNSSATLQADLHNSHDLTTSSASTNTMTHSSTYRTLPLTLILAATPKLGIGQSGQLPWPQLRTEMGYFARVTKRVPKAPTSSSSGRRKINAVIMGRKTWDSIPEKFRPLKGRINVVVTRDVGTERWKNVVRTSEEGPLVVGSVEEGLEALQRPLQSDPEQQTQSQFDDQAEVERVFVIGGSSLYAAALEMPQTNRVLLTKIRREYECDTFFSINLDEEEGRRKGWRRRSKEELEAYVGEEVKDNMEEKDVKFEFCLYEKGAD